MLDILKNTGNYGLEKANPIRIELSFNPEKYKADPSKCVDFSFIIQGDKSANIEQCSDSDINAISFVLACMQENVVSPAIQKRIAWKKEVESEISGLTGSLE